MFDVDVLIAGGGPAGCAAAAALADVGLSVWIADAGLDRQKQLAGELLHPAGVEDVRALGLGGVLDGAHAQQVLGFAVIDSHAASSRTALLPYGGGDRGLAFEHAAFTQPLLGALERRTGVTVLRRARVTEIRRNDAEAVEAVLSHEGALRTIRARMLVAADGRASPVRKLLGISERHERMSTMIGVTVPAEALSHPGHGHIFIGGPAPVLGYTIAPGVARVMVDLPLGSGPRRPLEEPEILAGVPSLLRGEILAAIEREAPRVASNDTRLPGALTSGRAVLIGDAAGCCHPLSASGISSCTRDARALQTAVREWPGDIPAALQLYARQRRPAQRTRIALASALYRAFAGTGGDMQALRAGLFRYWQRGRGGAQTSMSLLSSRESRMWVMAREYARVVGHGVVSLAGEAARRRGRNLVSITGAASGLVASAWPHLEDVVRGQLQDRRVALPVRAYAPPSRGAGSSGQTGPSGA